MGDSLAVRTEFLAIVTHPKIFRPPTPLAHALDQVAAWLESPARGAAGRVGTHWATLRAALEAGRISGRKSTTRASPRSASIRHRRVVDRRQGLHAVSWRAGAKSVDSVLAVVLRQQAALFWDLSVAVPGAARHHTDGRLRCSRRARLSADRKGHGMSAGMPTHD